MHIDDGDARIVNISSVSGVLATPFAGAYCASKFALNGLSDALRVELAPLGVRVITIQPGHIRSSFGATASSYANRDYSQSRYAPISDAIAERANASQHHATPAGQFARHAVTHMLGRTPGPSSHSGAGGARSSCSSGSLPQDCATTCSPGASACISSPRKARKTNCPATSRHRRRPARADHK